MLLTFNRFSCQSNPQKNAWQNVKRRRWKYSWPHSQILCSIAISVAKVHTWFLTMRFSDLSGSLEGIYDDTTDDEQEKTSTSTSSNCPSSSRDGRSSDGWDFSTSRRMKNKTLYSSDYQWEPSTKDDGSSNALPPGPSDLTSTPITKLVKCESLHVSSQGLFIGR